MTEKTERPGGEDDHGLSEELESLYRRIAQLDQPDASAPKGHFRGDDDEDFQALRRRMDHGRNQPSREELMDRLAAIREAYERLLTYWPYAACPSPFSAQEAALEPLIQESPDHP